jgi:hypothetical protein
LEQMRATGTTISSDKVNRGVEGCKFGDGS